MSVGSSSGSSSHRVPSSSTKPDATPRVKKHAQIIDPKVSGLGRGALREPASTTIGMIQHEADAHTFGDYLQDTCDKVTTVEGFLIEGGRAFHGEGSAVDLGIPGLVAKYDYQPSELNVEALKSEVDQIIGRSVAPPVEGGTIPPIAQRIVTAAIERKDDGTAKFPELNRVKKISDQIVGENDGFLLPGGDSIHPKFYGEAPDPADEAMYAKSIPRSVMEFCIINACKMQGKPLMGICRGHQAIAIYHGGALDRTTVAGYQAGAIRSLETTGNPKFLAQPPQTGHFQHSQVVTRIGSELQSVVHMNILGDLEKEYARLDAVEEGLRPFFESAEDFDGAAKMTAESKAKAEEVLNFLGSQRAILALENLFGAPIMGLQFHPEAVEIPQTPERAHFDVKGNQKVIEQFVQLAQVVEKKGALLEEIRALRKE